MPSDQDLQERYLEQAPLDGGGHFSVGRQLREVRETYDLEIEDVATALRIRPFYLQAIEETRYESLPGTTYAIGFVRAYAEYLRLDPKELVQRFKAEVSGLETRRSLQFPVPAQEGRVPGVALLLVAVLLAALGYGVWYYLGQEGTTFTDVVEPLPDDLAALVDSGDPSPGESSGPQEDPVAQENQQSQSDAPPPEALETLQSASEAPAVDEPLVAPLPEGLPAPDAPIDPDAAIDPGAAPGLAGAEETQGAPEPEVPPEPDAKPDAAGPSDAQTRTAAAGEGVESQAQAVQEQAAQESDPAADLLAQDQTGALQPTPETPQPPETPEMLESAEGAAEQPAAEAAEAAAPESGAQTGTNLPAPPPPERSGNGADLPEGRVYGAVNENARVVLLAESDSWVEVRDLSGRLILSRVLRRGDSYRVPSLANLVMMTGNAGGLAVTLDGQRLPSLGEQGQVRRDIPLEPEALKVELGQ